MYFWKGLQSHHWICEYLDLFPPEIWFWKWTVICLTTCLFLYVCKKRSVCFIWLDLRVSLFLSDSVSGKCIRHASVPGLLWYCEWCGCVCLSPELSRSVLCCPILQKPATDRPDWSSPSPHSHCELTSSSVNWSHVWLKPWSSSKQFL